MFAEHLDVYSLTPASIRRERRSTVRRLFRVMAVGVAIVAVSGLNSNIRADGGSVSTFANASRARESQTPNPRIKPIWLVVTRPMFADAIKPLVEHRAAGGFDAQVSTESLDKATKHLAKRQPKLVLLVGDDLLIEQGASDRPGNRQSTDPALKDQTDAAIEPWAISSARRNLYRWRSAQRIQFASDQLLADQNHDLIPDFAIGRIPAREVSEVETAVSKIIEYEKQECSIGDLGIPVWSGSPMYGKAIDAMANGLLLTMLQSASPQWAEPWVIMGDASQPFCGWPQDQVDSFLNRVRSGGILTAFIGHGQTSRVLSMRYQDRYIGLSPESIGLILSEGGATAPMILLTCEAGNFAAAQQSLAEFLLFQRGGPVAVIGASTESHPLTNYFTGQQLLESLDRKSRRLGDLWLGIQKRGFLARDLMIEPALKDVEGKLEEEINVSLLRRDQVLMYNILGDPATIVRLPSRLTARIEKQEDTWHWTAKKPRDAAMLRVDYRPNPIQLPPAVEQTPTREAAQKRFYRANAALSFENIATIDGNTSWQGEIERPGTVRLTTVVRGRLRVAVLEAK